MDILWQELTSGLPDAEQWLRVLIRLIAASVLGAVVGFQRERAGKPAGLRTHMLVSLGTVVFVLACTAVGMSLGDLSRIVQGIATGIGFIGAGSILKIGDGQEVKGLTTAAGIWMTAAIGAAVGLGSLGVALLGTVFALIVLAFAVRLEESAEKRRAARDGKREGP
jgi:putative Mg2+ transporter-C (MgtC) family protein